jgi:hypothetical protein
MKRFEGSFRGVARLGDVTYSLRSPAPANIYNEHSEFGDMFWNLDLAVPIRVTKPGTYECALTYSFAQAALRGKTERLEIRTALTPGDRSLTFSLEPWDAGSMGYWAPDRVGGTCQVILYYLASDQELLDAMKVDRNLRHGDLEDFKLGIREWSDHAPSEPWRPMSVDARETRF